ncbi:hypothetical protein SLA2020_455550 [Shorea laevis]
MADSGMEQTESGIGMKKMNSDFETLSLKKTEAETEKGKCSNPKRGVELGAAEEDAAVFFFNFFLFILKEKIQSNCCLTRGCVPVTCRNGGTTRRR